MSVPAPPSKALLSPMAPPLLPSSVESSSQCCVLPNTLFCEETCAQVRHSAALESTAVVLSTPGFQGYLLVAVPIAELLAALLVNGLWVWWSFQAEEMWSPLGPVGAMV